jgi:hypothetical protein
MLLFVLQELHSLCSDAGVLHRLHVNVPRDSLLNAACEQQSSQCMLLLLLLLLRSF